MKPEVTFVPKDVDIIEFLETMFKKRTSVWLSIHANVVDRLKEICHLEKSTIMKDWMSLKFIGHNILTITIDIDNSAGERWNKVTGILPSDFNKCHIDISRFKPEEIIFLKMEE